MNRLLIWQLAIRYLRGKRSANKVPVISRICMTAIGVGCAAMVVMFSVLNGFDFLVRNMYKALYPEIKITASRGKFFSDKAIKLQDIKNMKGVLAVTPVIEDNALAAAENELTEGDNRQKVVVVKGIENSYFDVNDISSFVSDSSITLSDKEPYTAIVGGNIASIMAVDPENVFSKILLYYQNPDVPNPERDPENAFESLKLHPVSLFQISDEFDDKYILAPLSVTQQLFHRQGQYSSIEIKTDPNAAGDIKAQLKNTLGSSFKVETRYEQNKTLFAMLSMEKLIGYIIILFILIIASFNMVSGLSMLVADKKKDIGILNAMGLMPSDIRRVFMLEGILWSGVGGFTGIAFGFLLCLLQQKLEIFKIKGSFVTEAFPVRILFSDIFVVVFTVLILGFLASLYPSSRASKSKDMSLKST